MLAVSRYKKLHLTQARLATIPILSNLSPADAIVVASLFQLKLVPAGSVLYNVDDIATTVIIV